MSDSLGRGRLLLDRAKLHDDIRLLGMAIRKRWQVSDEVKDAILERLENVIKFSDDDEVAIKAIAQVRAMEQQNQKDEHAQIDEFRNRVLTIAQRCGIDVNLLGFSSEAGGGSETSNTIDSTATERREG